MPKKPSPIISLSVCALLISLFAAIPAGAQTAPPPAAAPGSGQKPIDFQRQIRPILSDYCFHCHGHDATTRMAGLRLDQKDAAFEARKRGAAIVPGKPAESLLIKRVTNPDPARRMPPEYAHKTLTPQQIATLKTWIEQGAPWKEHWAFQTPVKPAPPAVRRTAWARNPIDRFILARLEERGLTPAPPADGRTLIRRVALDLTGLPPKPAEIAAFLADTSPTAYEHMVDRYLASPHYGEHRARYWLDAARYGDTHGIHVDNYREIWPYRDWVIGAFNRNLSFDRFTIEQLAGDMLPGATLDQRIATGFQRCNVTTNEAGIIEEEYAEIYAKDRADTIGAVFLGLTVGCATCHDHKFDPISQADFYSLGAFFRNTTQHVMDGNVPDTPPVVVVPRADDRPEWEKIAARQTAIREEMAEARKSAAAPFAEWLKQRQAEPAAHPLVGNWVSLPRDGGAPVSSSLDREPPRGQPSEAADELYTAGLGALAVSAPGVEVEDSPATRRPSLRFVKPGGVPVKDPPRLDAEKPFTVSVTFYFPKAEQGYTIAAHQDPKERGRGWVIDVGARVIGMRLIGDSGRNIEIRAGHLEQLVPGSWNNLVVSYDGSRAQPGLALYLNGRAIPTQGRGNQNTELAGSIGVDRPLLLGPSLPGGAIADFRMFSRAVTANEAALLATWPATAVALAADPAVAAADEASRQALFTWFLSRYHKPYQTLLAEQDGLTLDANAIARRGAVTLVMEERTDSKPVAHVLYRGAYDQQRQRVTATTPAILPPMPPDLPRNRLGFAQWLFRPEHPLTARVTVNRMWLEIFGAGIVKTADDFGSQGEPPSHPQLLDWLAVDFRENNWDVKRFYKQVLMSATYRQAAIATPDKLAKDPENRLLSRGPRFRMDGEMVRDYALASSGLLAPQIGGPSAKPYQPEGVWEAVAMIGSNTRFYKRDIGDGLYRRSLYTFWKRSAPPASLDIFNAPTRESCVVRRERTDTPLQALVTMNDPQFFEAARVLAAGAMESASGLDAEIDYLATRLLARPLNPRERVVARKAFDDFERFYAGHPGDAQKLLATGERKPDPGLAPPAYAALTMLTNELMNLDEVLNK